MNYPQLTKYYFVLHYIRILNHSWILSSSGFYNCLTNTMLALVLLAATSYTVFPRTFLDCGTPLRVRHLASLAMRISIRIFNCRPYFVFLFSMGGGHATVASCILCLAARCRTATYYTSNFYIPGAGSLDGSFFSSLMNLKTHWTFVRGVGTVAGSLWRMYRKEVWQSVNINIYLILLNPREDLKYCNLHIY